MDRPLPQSIEAEKGLLCSCLLSDKVMAKAVEAVSENFFHHPAHKTVWNCLSWLFTNRKPIDLISVTQALEDESKLEPVGGAPAITEIFRFVPTGSNWKYYLEIVTDKYKARKAIVGAYEILEAAYSNIEGEELSEITQSVLTSLAKLTESKSETKHIRDILTRRIDHYEEVMRNGSKLEGLSTGFEGLDRKLRGLRKGNMIVIGAKTKGGKTALAMNIVTHVAEQGNAVGVYSLEMNESELADRVLSAAAQVNMGMVAMVGMNKFENSRLLDAYGRLAKTNIYVRDESVLTATQFRSSARRLVTENGCKLLVVDYLQLMEPGAGEKNRERQVAESSRIIKTTASELGVPIIVLIQLNDDGRARESRAIEMDLNALILIEEEWSEPKGKEKPELIGHNLNIKLARDCETGLVPVTFLKKFTRFEPRTT